MEFLTCVVAAEEDEYPDIAQSNSPLNEWSGIEAPGLDTTKVATLHSLLTGDPLQGKTMTFSAQGQVLLDKAANVAEWTGIKLSINQLRALGELKANDLDKTPQISGALSIAQFDLAKFVDSIGQKLQRYFLRTGSRNGVCLTEPQAYIQRVYGVANAEFLQIVVALVECSQLCHYILLAVGIVFSYWQFADMLQQ